MISSAATLFDYRPGTQLRVTGEDAFGFLQGQFTNDLRQPPGRATYGLWLNQKGKILADSHVLRMGEKEFLMTSAHSPVAVIRQRLEDYIVADDVVLTDETATAQGLLLSGPGSATIVRHLLGEVPAPGRFGRQGEILAYGGRRLPGESFELLGPERAITEIRRQFVAQGAIEAAAAEIEFARISAGIPSVPTDLGLGDLPNEGGLEDSALSYTKGCYLGQEVMARLKNLGQVRRRLHVVRGRGAAPASLAALFQREKKAGELRSVASRGEEFVALAMLSLINFNPDAGLSFVPGGPTVVTADRHG
jgi:folate-binding protein YgfZ